MKILLKVVGGFAALILALVLVAFFFPREYRIERSIVTKAKPEVVMAQVGDLKMWKNWGAWQERDPAMKMTYGPVTTGVGAWSAWESAKEGNGKMTITTQSTTKVASFPTWARSRTARWSWWRTPAALEWYGWTRAISETIR
jgi:hypothetical protein